MVRVANILTAVDPTKPGPALAQALFWTQQFDATLHAVHVHSPKGDALPSSSSSPYSSSKEVQRAVLQHADHVSLDISSDALHAITMEASSKADGLLRYATDHAIDLIVMAPSSDERTLPVLQEHTLADLVQRASCPVLIVDAADTVPLKYQHLLAPIDFSRHAQRGLGHAKLLASLYGASLDVLHVLERPQYVALSPTDMLSLSDAKLPERKALRRARSLFDSAPGPDVEAHFHVAHGDPTQQIAAFAQKHDNDLIVLASHGSTGQSHHALGTTTDKMLRRLPLPSFLVKSFGSSLVSFDAPPTPIR